MKFLRIIAAVLLLAATAFGQTQRATNFIATNDVKALTFTSNIASPAGSGVIRLGNGELIAWEASPAGTDVTLTVNSSEQFVFSAGASFAGAISGTTGTFSALTSGRVPFVSTAGLLTDEAAFAYNSGTNTFTIDSLTANSGTALTLNGNGAGITINPGATSQDLTVNLNGTGQLKLLGSTGQLIQSATVANLTLNSTAGSGKSWSLQSYTDGAFYITNTGVADAVKFTVAETTIYGTLTATSTTQSAGDSSTKLATTAFVQAAILQTPAKEAVKYASTAALPSIVYANGSSGVGATLTGVALAAISLDSSSPSVADRVLIKNQASTFQNGIYTVTATGSGIAVFVLTRAADFDQAVDIKTGDSTLVTAGSTLSSTTWNVSSADSPVMGTDAITFVQTAGPGSVTSGNGITVTGASVAIDTSVTVDKNTAQTLTNKTLTAAALGSSTATTQSAGDNSTKVSTTAYADAAVAAGVTSTSTTTFTNKTNDIGSSMSSDDTYRGEVISGLNNSGGVTQWDVVYLNSSSQWVKADANGSSTYPAVGIATATVSTGNATTVLVRGIFRDDGGTSWTIGGNLYLSTTAGAMTSTAPATTGDKIQVIGTALAAHTVYVHPSTDFGTAP